MESLQIYQIHTPPGEYIPRDTHEEDTSGFYEVVDRKRRQKYRRGTSLNET